MDDLKTMLEQMLEELNCYPLAGSGSGGHEYLKLNTGHPLCDIGRRVVRAIPVQRRDENGDPNFPGNGGKLWYRLLRISRSSAPDEKLLEETAEELSRWLRQQYRAELAEGGGRSDSDTAFEHPPAKPKRFAVALSFPNEDRSFVLKVAESLARTLNRDRVFYDEWYEVELLGVGGDLKLQSMYTQADLVIPFFSKYYSKPWCSLEWETIRGILLNRRKDDAVIPVHLDDTDIPGWAAVNFGIQLRDRPANQIAEVILQALAIRTSKAEKVT